MASPAVVGASIIPRLWDWRVGPWYRTQRGYFLRQHLELRDSSQAASDVAKPLVYVIDATVPREWVPWIRRGIEAWIPAFDQIGFKHAIVVRDDTADQGAAPQMPGCQVTWNPVATGAATTNLEANEEIGEVTGCVIVLNPGVLPMLQQFASMQIGGTYPALAYPYADSVAGRLMQMVVTHETGHSLGFNENFEAGTSYPTDSLHSASFVHRFGHTPSVMGYAFFNAVAQAKDHIPLEDLFMRIGPWDVWSLRMVYRPVPGAKSSEDELPAFERWRAAQDTAFGMRMKTIPATRGLVDGFRLGNDLVASATAITQNMALAVPNIERQASIGAPSASVGLASLLRRNATTIWSYAITGAATTVGTSIPDQPYVQDQTQQHRSPVDSSRQMQALRFVLAHAVYGQDPLVQALFGRSPADTSVMLFENPAPGWSVEEWQELQRSVLDDLWHHVTVQSEDDGLVAQASKTHVLPAYCQVVRRLKSDITKAAASAKTPAGQTQADNLLSGIDAALDPCAGSTP